MSPKTTKTTVHYDEHSGSYKVTIPKGLGDGMGLAGAALAWDILSETAVEPFVYRGSDRTTSTVSRSSGGQYQTQIPEDIAGALVGGLDEKTVEWTIKGGERLRMEVLV